jgi:hypothetical protein
MASLLLWIQTQGLHLRNDLICLLLWFIQKSYFLVTCLSWCLSQVYVIDSANPTDGLQRLCERTSGVQYFVEHHSGQFYFLTNAPLPDGKWSGDEYYLVRCRVEDIQSPKLQVVCDELHTFFSHLRSLLPVHLCVNAIFIVSLTPIGFSLLLSEYHPSW